MKIGPDVKATTAISGSNPDTIVVRGSDLVRELIGRISFTDHVWLLITGRFRQTRSVVCWTPRWWRSPSTVWCRASWPPG
jgi:hypothetical protein